MKKRTTQAQIRQRIQYEHESEHEEWQFETTAELIELTSFTKLAYQDEQEVAIELKWQQHAVSGNPTLSIKQPAYTLVFNLEQKTLTHYQTPQGVWPLEIETEHLSWKQVGDQQQVTVLYSTKVNEIPFGKYEYQLIYNG